MNKNQINKLLNSNDRLLIENYFLIQEEYEKIYGKDTIILLELGSFYEVYEVDNDEEQLGKARELADVLNIQLTRKNKKIKEITRKNCFMSGVPTVSLEKHLNKLISLNKYTLVLLKQKELANNKFERYVADIISPGTNFFFLQDNDNNYLTSIIIEEYQKTIDIGYSAIDISTGNIICNETRSFESDKTFALDYLQSLISSNSTNEIIITADKKNDIKKTIQSLQISSKTLHFKEQRYKTTLQNELFSNVFLIKSFLSSIEFLNLENNPLASESLFILLDFVLEHDSDLVKKAKIPEIKIQEDFLFLGNNALEQLNIDNNDKNQSIFNIVNNTKTSIGRRLLKDRLFNPIKNKEELVRRYSLSEEVELFEKEIGYNINNVYDLERLFRKMELLRMHPYELNYFYNSLESVKNICQIIENNNIKNAYSINCKAIDNIIEEIDNNIVLSESSSQSLNDIEINFIKPNVEPKIDSILLKNEEIFSKLLYLQDSINGLFELEGNFCKLERNIQEGFFFSLTKSKYNSIKDKDFYKNVSVKNKKLSFKKDFNFTTLKNSVKIKSDYITSLSNSYFSNLQKIADLNQKIFFECCSNISNSHSADLLEFIKFIGDIDVSLSNLTSSKKLNLTKPIILDFNKSSYVEAQQLRHLIVESNEESGIYVPNDIVLGEQDNYNSSFSSTMTEQGTVQGALLFGINSSGKSTLLKSIGVSIVLAQAGLFVPAKEFKYSLFESIFTRIQGSDNIYQGLSSFAVEMIELKNIFNRANERSLILGDELSHSTETISGLSIVASSLLKFIESNSIFVLATHLHQLPELKELKDLNQIKSFHLSTDYNQEDNSISFDRIIKKGKGSSIYGLEFASSLDLDQTFLKNAETIRKRISNDYTDIERLGFKKKSKYNSNKLKSVCQICGEPAVDTHHIVEQQDFNSNQFKDHIKKNHKYNLVDLCKNCHNEVHNDNITIEGYQKTSKGLKLIFNKKKAEL